MSLSSDPGRRFRHDGAKEDGGDAALEAQLYIAKAKQFSAEATAAMKRFTQRCSHVECRSCRD